MGRHPFDQGRVVTEHQRVARVAVIGRSEAPQRLPVGEFSDAPEAMTKGLRLFGYRPPRDDDTLRLAHDLPKVFVVVRAYGVGSILKLANVRSTVSEEVADRHPEAIMAARKADDFADRGIISFAVGG